MTVDIETNGFDEMNEGLKKAVDNANDLQEAFDIPSLTIKWSKNCTFNITINKGD